MRLIGTIILIVGVVIGLVTLSQGLIATSPTPPDQAPDSAAVGYPLGRLAFAGIAVVIGVLLINFGGSGVIKTKDPAVRN